MKKLVLLLAVLLSLTAVSAADNSITVNFSPYGLEYKTSSNEADSTMKSDRGAGADLKYQRQIAEGIYAEAGIGFNRMHFGSYTPMESDILLYAGAEYRKAVTSWISLFAHADLGEDTTLYGKYAQATFALKTGAGLAFTIDEVSFNFGCDGSFSFCFDSRARYIDYRILPVFGLTCQF